eukprot:TRINITY_DN799_c0_g1_i1.p1 TRINITY_DN799_c0_g1~~TRINITY_DN799_c0_g1_i1.p1  ORF type:complete len:332 (-),score=53.60 TRINITY_DN799_c0_g1_i1:138-1103(-)
MLGFLIITSVLFLGILSLVFIYHYQNRFLFLPKRNVATGLSGPDEFGILYNNVYINTSDDIKLHGWHLIQERENGSCLDLPTIIYFHGNSGNLVKRLQFLKKLYFSDISPNIIIFSYRGFGLSDPRNVPIEVNAHLDAEAMVKYAFSSRFVNKKKVFLFGHSMGAAIMIDYLFKNKGDHDKFAGVILQNTFTSLPDAIVDHIPYLMYGKFLIKTKFNNLAKVVDFNIPALFISCKFDKLIYSHHMEKLYALWGSKIDKENLKKYFCSIQSSNHNGAWIDGGLAYYRTIAGFVKKSLGNVEFNGTVFRRRYSLHSPKARKIG